MDEQKVAQLKRVVGSDVSEIVLSSRHASVYCLRIDASGREIWEKEKIEGIFYLVKRQTNPAYVLCILNRLTTNDFVEPVRLGEFDFEFEFKARFLIYRDKTAIRAVWFGEDETDSFSALKDCLERCEREILSRPPQPKYVSRPPPREGQESDLTRDEMRDALLRLVTNDKVMDTLHSQYVESKRKLQQLPQPQQPQQQMGMAPPHHHSQYSGGQYHNYPPNFNPEMRPPYPQQGGSNTSMYPSYPMPPPGGGPTNYVQGMPYPMHNPQNMRPPPYPMARPHQMQSPPQ